MQALVMVVAWVVLGAAPPASETARRSMAKLVARIQTADYEGDRKRLARLAGEMAPYVKDAALSSPARYWRGFAWWRRALNGFNEKDADPKELELDLSRAVEDFAQIPEKDPLYADARSAAAATSWNLGWLKRADPEVMKQYIQKGVAFNEAAKAASPENPRVLWVVGGGQWYVPVERGGGQAKAIETYERALELARREKGRVTDPLMPSWGEAELHMNLAWSHLSRATPDLEAAESNARAALALVPSWHYVRDILLPQILEAKAKARKPASAAGF